MLATCLGCGCTCDDIDLTVERNRIVEARNACALGRQWYGDGTVAASVRVDGRDAALADALTAATQLLTSSSRALVYLAPDLTCEAQRQGIALADALHASLDTITSATALGSIPSPPPPRSGRSLRRRRSGAPAPRLAKSATAPTSAVRMMPTCG
jgi:formylmethanofuran dehydrogenase subunit B